MIGLIALVVLLFLLVREPRPQNIRVEMVKACIQIISVTIIGGLITLAVNRISHRRTVAYNEESRRKDDLQHQYESMASILDRSVSAYNSVKKTRRLLDARTRHKTTRTITLEEYDKYMEQLSVQQLNFESLKRMILVLVPLSSYKESRESLSKLSAYAERVEQYLNNIVREYRENRYKYTPSDMIPLRDLAELRTFIENTSDFKKNISNGLTELEEILINLQNQMLSFSKY